MLIPADTILEFPGLRHEQVNPPAVLLHTAGDEHSPWAHSLISKMIKKVFITNYSMWNYFRF